MAGLRVYGVAPFLSHPEVAMARTAFPADVAESRAALLRRAPALGEGPDARARGAPGGTAFDACENAALTGGRDLPRQSLQDAAARRAAAAEKKGRLCGRAPAAGPRRIAAPRP